MPERLSRSESKRRTRQALIETAGRIFVARGYVGASMEEIAREVGVTKGAIYRHFDNKEDLFFALLEEGATEDQRRWATRPPTPDPSALGPELHALSAAQDPRDRALYLEFLALALRDPALGQRMATQLRQSWAEAAEVLKPLFGTAAETSREVAVIASLLIETLVTHRLLTPDLITDATFTTATEMLANAMSQGGQ